MSVSEAQAKLSATEFYKWCWFLDWQETEEFQRSDYYHALIAWAITRGYAKDPGKVKLDHFLLKFGEKKQKQVQKKKPETMEEAMERANAMFGWLIGMSNKDKGRK